ncbi:MAG TPA: PadR family transcriptional regulator [Streptosporangiaceae bacterium]|nr:PadR family transcriptional regulator [Streptosporangiaceae bacterium]
MTVPIRHGLLALLARGPRYGYQLRSEFESSTGITWPLNIGQVYSTLSRLERDGLADRMAADREGRYVYRLRPEGADEMRSWFATPVERGDRPRDELVIKVAMAVTTPGVDAREVVQIQRRATLRTLRDLGRLREEAAVRPDADAPGDAAAFATAWRLVLDSMIFQAEAEIRWLDHCEAGLPPARGSQGDQVVAARAGRSALPGPDAA